MAESEVASFIDYLKVVKNFSEHTTKNYKRDLDKFVGCYKIGSGDITWHKMLHKIASKGKPVIIATGASKINEVIDYYILHQIYNDVSKLTIYRGFIWEN